MTDFINGVGILLIMALGIPVGFSILAVLFVLFLKWSELVVSVANRVVNYYKIWPKNPRDRQ